MNDLPSQIEVSPDMLKLAIEPGMVIVGEPDSCGTIRAMDVANEELANELGRRIAKAGGTAYLAKADVELFKAYRPKEELKNSWL